MLSYRAWPELPVAPPEPVSAGMAHPPDLEADRLGSSAELPDTSCVLTMFLFFFCLHTARAALLTGRLPIRSGFYTTNGQARNGACALGCAELLGG